MRASPKIVFKLNLLALNRWAAVEKVVDCEATLEIGIDRDDLAQTGFTLFRSHVSNDTAHR
jgi:hypothetical protein